MNLKDAKQLRNNKLFHSIKNTNIKKLRNLVNRELVQVKTADNWFRNLSDITFPSEVKNFHALGPKFSVSPSTRDISIPRLLADVEYIVEKHDEPCRDVLRARVTHAITHHLEKTGGNSSTLQIIFKKTKLLKKNHPECIITRADKGNVTVAMSREQFIEKALQILNDEKYYTVLNRDPTLTFQKRANEFIKQLVNKNFITETEGKKLYTYKAIPAMFYGLPKIHKAEVALRPIVSSVNTPTSTLAVLAAEIISSSLNNDSDPYYIKDSFQFYQQL